MNSSRKAPKPTRFRKISRQEYLVYIEGKRHEFGNRASARKFYRSTRAKGTA